MLNKHKSQIIQNIQQKKRQNYTSPVSVNNEKAIAKEFINLKITFNGEEKDILVDTNKPIKDIFKLKYPKPHNVFKPDKGILDTGKSLNYYFIQNNAKLHIILGIFPLLNETNKKTFINNIISKLGEIINVYSLDINNIKDVFNTKIIEFIELNHENGYYNAKDPKDLQDIKYINMFNYNNYSKAKYNNVFDYINILTEGTSQFIGSSTNDKKNQGILTAADIDERFQKLKNFYTNATVKENITKLVKLREQQEENKEENKQENKQKKQNALDNLFDKFKEIFYDPVIEIIKTQIQDKTNQQCTKIVKFDDNIQVDNQIKLYKFENGKIKEQDINYQENKQNIKLYFKCNIN